MNIVAASAADLADVLAVERLAFGGEVEAGLVAELIADPTAQPHLSLLARPDDRAVGHILFTAARLEGAAPGPKLALLAPLAVIPDAQRKGIGGSLIEHGIRLLGEAGVALVFVLGHPGYYPRHGFEPAGRHGLRAPYPVSPESAWMVRPISPSVLGRVQGRVICADALDRPEYWIE